MKTCNIIILALAVVFGLSCNKSDVPTEPVPMDPEPAVDLSLENVARIISCLPIGQDQMNEVYGAVNSSSSGGYDEEYTMQQLFENPGAGVGETKAKISSEAVPLKDMFADYFAKSASTKGSAQDVTQCLTELSESGLQIYWPYSENWDGEELPLITYDPGYEIRSNYAYELKMTENGLAVVDSVYVDEALAQERPVWVVNNNSDADYTPLESISLDSSAKGSSGDEESQDGTNLYLKSICALRNYDSWFAGGSEYFIKAGSVSGLKITENDDLKNYYPQLNDIMVVVKRSEVGKVKEIGNILVSGFSDYQDKIVFMLTEDDGGTITNWTCSATVKIKSKSYGIDISIPFNSRDDIIWRGQIDAGYFRKASTTEGRFGDVKLSFEVK